MKTTAFVGALIAAATLTAGAASAQTGVPYGAPITLDSAKAVGAAAHAEAVKRKVSGTFAIVDVLGEMVVVDRGMNASNAGVEIALAKARSAVKYRKTGLPLAEFPAGAEGLTGGSAMLVSGGQIVGAIGVTGGSNDQVVSAAVAALK